MMDNNYDIGNRWEELENKIINLLVDADNDLKKAEHFRTDEDAKDPAFKELVYDLDCEIRLFKHLLATMKFWKETICLTEEKSVKD